MRPGSDLVPGRGLLRLLAGWTVVALAAAAWPDGPWPDLWRFAGLAIAGLAGLALLDLAGPGPVDVDRRVDGSLPLGEWSTVDLELRRRAGGLFAGRPVRLEVHDHHPTGAEVEGLPHHVVLPGNGGGGDTGTRLAYRLRPRVRGPARFEAPEVWQTSILGLLRRRRRPGPATDVRVLPNFRPLLVQGLAGVEERMASLGFHLQRRRGAGLEFRELRDFREGDTVRQVDWKATARRGRLIAREYQDERDQQIVLLVDCGRRMHARDGDLQHFDHVLDACLLLAYIAHRQGDAVGLQAFAGEERWLPPVRGAATVPRLLDALHDLETTSDSPDYTEAAALLMRRQRRRALVLLLTNLRDEDAEELLPALESLRRHHLVVVASTRERELGAMRDQPVLDHRAALEVAAAHHYLEARERAHARIRAAGALVLDVEPRALPHRLVASYLEIKRAGQL